MDLKKLSEIHLEWKKKEAIQMEKSYV